jgi:hypothetical protein
MGCYSTTDIVFDIKQDIPNDFDMFSVSIRPVFTYKTTLFYLSKNNTSIDISFTLITDEIIESLTISSCKLIIGKDIIEFTNKELNKYSVLSDIIWPEKNKKYRTYFRIEKEMEMNNIKNIFLDELEREMILDYNYNVCINGNEKQYKNEILFNSSRRVINYKPSNLWKGDL